MYVAFLTVQIQVSKSFFRNWEGQCSVDLFPTELDLHYNLNKYTTISVILLHVRTCNK